MWDVRFSKNAEKDKKLLKQAGLEEKAKKLLDILREDPFQNPPSYEKLVGDLKGYYSRRINLQHRLVYKVDLEEKIVEVRAMWTHYER
jgi:toxin YoeB